MDYLIKKATDEEEIVKAIGLFHKILGDQSKPEMWIELKETQNVLC